MTALVRELDARPAMRDVQPAASLQALHARMRDGFCGVLQALAPDRVSEASGLRSSFAELTRLLDACEALHDLERDTVLQQRCEADSSWANEDLAWGVEVLWTKIDKACGCGQAGRFAAEDLYRYLARFLGELLVHFHAKEAALAAVLGPGLRPRRARRWIEGIAEVEQRLSPPGKEGE